MGLIKSKGNMYSWVSHTHTHLGGKCSHECKYCYVQAMSERFPVMKNKFSGPLRLLEDEFKVDYGKGKVIFIEHCNDLFASNVPQEFLHRILAHCAVFPSNTYVFQTKNTERMFKNFVLLPPDRIIGTTIESDIDYPDISKAPLVWDRIFWLAMLEKERKFVTIEPVLDFNVHTLAALVAGASPFFVNLGADSKNRGLPEPSVEKVMDLVQVLGTYNIELREKHNLKRLKAK